MKLKVAAVASDIPVDTVVGSLPGGAGWYSGSLEKPHTPHALPSRFQLAKKEKHLITVGLSELARILHWFI